MSNLVNVILQRRNPFKELIAASLMVFFGLAQAAFAAALPVVGALTGTPNLLDWKVVGTLLMLDVFAIIGLVAAFHAGRRVKQIIAAGELLSEAETL